MDINEVFQVKALALERRGKGPGKERSRCRQGADRKVLTETAWGEMCALDPFPAAYSNLLPNIYEGPDQPKKQVHIR